MGDNCDNLIRNGCLPQQTAPTQESEITSLKLFKSVAVPISEHRKGLRGETLLISDFGNQGTKKSNCATKIPVFCFGFVIGVIVAIILFTLITYLLHGYGNVSFNFSQNLRDATPKDQVDKVKPGGGFHKHYGKEHPVEENGRRENPMDKWSLTNVFLNPKQPPEQTPTNFYTTKSKNLINESIYSTTISSEVVRRTDKVEQSLKEINNSVDNKLTDIYGVDAVNRQNLTTTPEVESYSVPNDFFLLNVTTADSLETTTSMSPASSTASLTTSLTMKNDSQKTSTAESSTSGTAHVKSDTPLISTPVDGENPSTWSLQNETFSSNTQTTVVSSTAALTTTPPFMLTLLTTTYHSNETNITFPSMFPTLPTSSSIEKGSQMSTLAVFNFTNATESTTFISSTTEPITRQSLYFNETNVNSSIILVVDKVNNTSSENRFKNDTISWNGTMVTLSEIPGTVPPEIIYNASMSKSSAGTDNVSTPANSSDNKTKTLSSTTVTTTPLATAINNEPHLNASDAETYLALNSTGVRSNSSNDNNLTNKTVVITNEKGEPISNSTRVCPENKFPCATGNLMCFEDRMRCNGVVDCPDHSDEQNCTGTCGLNFNCGNTTFAQCIPQEVYCDGLWDCENGNDEVECQLSSCKDPNEVMCKDKSACLMPYKICDGVYNCKDHSDEQGCIDKAACAAAGKYMCSNNNQCIDSALRCDGHPDCPNGEDEADCDCGTKFKCEGGQCVDEDLRCNGAADCKDGSDEWSCYRVDENSTVFLQNFQNKTWAPLCYRDEFSKPDADLICNKLSFGVSLKYGSISNVSLAADVQWAAYINGSYEFTDNCTTEMALYVQCEQYECSSKSGGTDEKRTLVKIKAENATKSECLAEIISPIWLITSADCLSLDDDVTSSVWSNSTTKVGLVDQVLLHPHASKIRSPLISDYDVALVKLQTPIDFNATDLKAICLPEQDIDLDITCFVPRYEGAEPIPLKVHDNKVCNSVEHYNATLVRRQICASRSQENDEDLAKGSSLRCLSGTSKWFVAGVLSYENTRKTFMKHPTVFSNIFSMKGFIKAATGMGQYEVLLNKNT